MLLECRNKGRVDEVIGRSPCDFDKSELCRKGLWGKEEVGDNTYFFRFPWFQVKADRAIETACFSVIGLCFSELDTSRTWIVVVTREQLAVLVVEGYLYRDRRFGNIGKHEPRVYPDGIAAVD